MPISYRVRDDLGRVRVIDDRPELLADVAAPQRTSLNVTLQRLAENQADLLRRGA